MLIKVKVKPNAKSNLVEIVWKSDPVLEKKLNLRQQHEASAEYNVFTTEPPEDDKANKKVQELLADYFGKPKSKVILDYGGKSREKFYEILD